VIKKSTIPSLSITTEAEITPPPTGGMGMKLKEGTMTHDF